MSLLAWFPLTKDMTNHGVLPMKLTNNDATLQTTGKIGSCYYLNKKTLSSPNFTALQQAENFSACCWIKFTDFPSSSNAYCISLNAKASDDSKFILGIYSKSGTTAVFRLNLTGDVGTLQLNTWYHLAICVQGTTGYMYINGELVNTVTSLSVNNAASNLIIGGRSTNDNGTAFTGTSAPAYYNDVRIYDHCLSPREVKAVAQALILHLPLKDGMMEGTTNLVAYPTPGDALTTSWDASLHPDAINVSNWTLGYNGGVSNPATGYHAYWKLVDGLPTIIFNNLNSVFNVQGRWLGINGGNLAGKIKPGDTYTVSFDVKSNVDGATVRSGLYAYSTSTGKQSFLDSQVDFTTSTSWKRMSYTKTAASTTDSSKAIALYIYGHYGIESITEVRNIQIELKDHATPYTPSTRTAIVEDCSGYGHHGSVVGSVPTIQDGGRHNSCIFQGDGVNNYVYSGTISMPTDAVTMSCWFKSSDAGYNSYHIPLSFDASNYEMSIPAAGTQLRTGFSIAGARKVDNADCKKLNDGQWHMLTTTYDGATIKRYVDGAILGTTTSATGSLAGGTGNFYVGTYNSGGYANKNAYMNDVRVYATALSADAIEKLYSSRISMHQTGDFMAFDLIEDGASNLKFTEQGLTRTGNISEIQNSFEMPIKVLESDNSVWARIHWLKLTNDQTVFASAAEVAECVNKTNRYSRMGWVDNFKDKDGKWEFMLTYPSLSSTLYNRWSQTNSPNVAANAGTGLVKITTAWNDYSSALTKSAMSSSAVYCTNTSSNWWSPIGQLTIYNSVGIPAADKSTQTEVELWVRIDNLPDVTKISMFDNKFIQATRFCEI